MSGAKELTPSKKELTPSSLRDLVLDKVALLGKDAAAEFFEVAPTTINNWVSLKSEPSLTALQKAWDNSIVAQTPEIWGEGGKAHVQILLPIYRYPHPLNHISLFINYKKYGPEKINIIPKFRTLIDEARNDLAAQFLATTSEWCVMVDEDMILPVGSAAAMRKHGWPVSDEHGAVVGLERLMSHPKEYRIVGALYRDRRGNNKAQCAKGFGNPQDNARLVAIMDGKAKPTGLEECGWVGTGMMRIHRSVFEEMAAAAKGGTALQDILPPPGRENEPIGFFGRSSKHRGEDVAFGRRAEFIGIKSYLDTSLYCGHEGSRIF